MTKLTNGKISLEIAKLQNYKLIYTYEYDLFTKRFILVLINLKVNHKGISFDLLTNESKNNEMNLFESISSVRKQQILSIIELNKQINGHALSKILGISAVAVYRHLQELVLLNILIENKPKKYNKIMYTINPEVIQLIPLHEYYGSCLKNFEEYKEELNRKLTDQYEMLDYVKEKFIVKKE